MADEGMVDKGLERPHTPFMYSILQPSDISLSSLLLDFTAIDRLTNSIIVQLLEPMKDLDLSSRLQSSNLGS